MADAAIVILERDATTTSGNFFIDEDVLASAGVYDFSAYSVVPGSQELLSDLFL